MEEVDGGAEAFKTSVEIKILYWKDLWSWIAVIRLRFRWEPRRRYMSVSCHVGRTARNNQKIYFLYRTCSNFNPNPPSPQKEI